MTGEISKAFKATELMKELSLQAKELVLNELKEDVAIARANAQGKRKYVKRERKHPQLKAVICIKCGKKTCTTPKSAAVWNNAGGYLCTTCRLTEEETVESEKIENKIGSSQHPMKWRNE